jgi:hypothetical protein
MPTAFVAPKPVPPTVTTLPCPWVVGVSVMAPAALAIGMTASIIESTRQAIKAVVHAFVLCCVFFKN